MKITYFFDLLEKANEFKGLVGETLKTKVFVKLNDCDMGSARTLEQFWDIVGSEVKEAILEEELKETSSVREFKIVFVKDEEKNNIKLYVE